MVLLLVPIACWVLMVVVACVLRSAGRPSAVAGGERGCGACGYSLTGLVEGARCPECGSAAAGSVVRRVWWEDPGVVWPVAFAAGVVAQAPAVVGCVVGGRRFEPIFFLVILAVTFHIAVMATAVAIVSARGVRWLTVASLVVLAGGAFVLEAWQVGWLMLSPPTDRISQMYLDLHFWTIFLVSPGLAAGVFVVAGFVVAGWLWVRGPARA